MFVIYLLWEEISIEENLYCWVKVSFWENFFLVWEKKVFWGKKSFLGKKSGFFEKSLFLGKKFRFWKNVDSTFERKKVCFGGKCLNCQDVKIGWLIIIIIIIIIGLLIHMAVKTELHGMNYKTIAIWLVIFNSNKVPKSFSISRYKI